MGDLVGNCSEGALYWVPLRELTRIRKLQVNASSRTALLAEACALNALYMVSRSGSVPPVDCFSRLEIVLWLHENELSAEQNGRDVYISSGPADTAALYSVLIALERLPFAELHRVRQSDGVLSRGELERAGASANGVSLAMGISKAKGTVLADRLRGTVRRVFVVMGEAEAQEGQLWESLLSAVNLGLHEVVAIICASGTAAGDAPPSALGDLLAKFRAFGWHGEQVDGGHLEGLGRALAQTQNIRAPKVLAVHGWKAPRGPAHADSLPGAAARAHPAQTYGDCCQALITRVNQRCDELSVARITFDSMRPPSRTNPARLQRLRESYDAALAMKMGSTPELTVLDAGVAGEAATSAIREGFPERWIACPAAEMDMVSMAGAIAVGGLIPVCQSSAFLLATRANEQIYGNGTEHLRVIYAANHAGVLAGGPPHVLPSVRDLSAVGNVPDLVAFAPSCESEVSQALSWCVQEHRGGFWLRLESIPWPVPFELPKDYQLELGVGVSLRPGTDALLIGYGPVLLSEAVLAAEKLAESGVSAAVVNLPWLNRVHAPWLSHTLSGFAHVFSLDNHHLIGGQGDRIAEIMARAGFARWPRLHRCAVEGNPTRGEDTQVLREHGLDAVSLHDRVLGAVRAGRTAR